MATTPYDTDLDRNPANFQPLTPLSFLERAAAVFPDQQGDHPRHALGAATPNSTPARGGWPRRWPSAASSAATRSSVMLANTPAMLEAHYGVPMTGAVLNTLNTRLDAAIIAFTLDHGETKVLITDREFSKVMKEALDARQGEAAGHRLRRSGISPAPASGSASSNTRSFCATAIPNFAWRMPDDEWDAIALNYTSGTTGDPKGVVYHHRGAYLLAMAMSSPAAWAKHPVYLWTLPMFHCNGWCFPWTLSVVAGTHVCLR